MNFFRISVFSGFSGFSESKSGNPDLLLSRIDPGVKTDPMVPHMWLKPCWSTRIKPALAKCNIDYMTHTEERPFGCTKCDMSFSHSTNLKKTWKDPHRREAIFYSNWTSYFQKWVFEKIMKWPTQEKSHLSVQNVISDLYKVVVWEPIKGSLEQRSHIPVPNVACHLHIVESWRCMTGSTQERSYLLFFHIWQVIHKKIKLWNRS